MAEPHPDEYPEVNPTAARLIYSFIWLLAGVSVSIIGYLTSLLLLGIGHGSPFFYQVYGAGDYGFLFPAIVGLMMALRQFGFPNWIVLLAELLQFTFVAVELSSTGIDIGKASNMFISLPLIVWINIPSFLIWHVSVLLSLLLSHLRTSKSTIKQPQTPTAQI